MGQLTITLPDDLEEEIREAVRNGKYGSVSDFARDAFKGELSGRPSYWERFLAVHVLENNKMLKQLTDDQNWGSDELLEALRRGYPNRYSDAHSLVYYEGITLEDTDFVQCVLEMYRTLQHGYDSSGVEDEQLAKDVFFEGFDGNAGDGYLGFTSFLVDNGRFATVRPLDKTPHLNSHSMVNDMYRRMLAEYNAIMAKKDRWHMEPLTLDEVKRVIAAQTHPEFKKMSVRTAALSPEKGFLHLIYDYLYLALAAYAWHTYGYGADDTAEKAINSLVPGAGVLLQDSLLLHARSLIDFYTKVASDDTDILLEDFGFRPISATRKAKLKRYKPSIELHLLHLTAYRDKDYRRSHPTTARRGSPPSGRIVWNRSNKNVAKELLECLRTTAGQRSNAWSRPFSDLYNAASKELTNPGAWPGELANAGDVKKYLRSLGFSV